MFLYIKIRIQPDPEELMLLHAVLSLLAALRSSTGADVATVVSKPPPPPPPPAGIQFLQEYIGDAT